MFTFASLGGRIILIGFSFRKAALPVTTALAGMLEPRKMADHTAEAEGQITKIRRSPLRGKPADAAGVYGMGQWT